MRRNRFFYLIIFLLTLLAYSNSFEASFHHDDIHVIVRNAFIKDIGNLPLFFGKPQMGSGIYGETSSYRPLLMATFSLNYLFGGLNPFGYHLFNFVLHVFCAILVYRILLRILFFSPALKTTPPIGHPLAALFGALIFALHPVQTESVTYITGRSSLLVSFFLLASFLAYLQYHLGGSRFALIFSSLAYAGALLAKETAVTLLAVLGVFLLLFPQGRSLRQRCLSLLPHLLLSSFYMLFRIYFFGSLQYGSEPVRSLSENLLTQPRAWVHYLGTLILPLNLNVDYDFPVSLSFWEGPVVLSVLALSAIFLAAWRLSRADRLVGFFVLWMTINLLPTNSLIPLEDLVSDRWLYLSALGYAGLLALGAAWVFRIWAQRSGRLGILVFFFISALVVEFYGFSALLRNFDWRNQRTLWEDAVAKSPNKARPYNGLGLALVLQNRLEEAEEKFFRAIALDPRGGQPYLNLGYVYSLQKKHEKAIAYYEKAIPLNPRLLSEIYNNLGLVYFDQGKMEKAQRSLEKAIEIRPYNPAPHLNLGIFFEEKGEVDRAIACLETAVRLSPDSFLAHEALSRLYLRKGWAEKSREARRKSLHSAPRD